MQNRTFGPYLAAMHRILIPVMVAFPADRPRALSHGIPSPPFASASTSAALSVCDSFLPLLDTASWWYFYFCIPCLVLSFPDANPSRCSHPFDSHSALKTPTSALWVPANSALAGATTAAPGSHPFPRVASLPLLPGGARSKCPR
jgi:hypothetical protein